jgi:predicted GIY-YIG superfamily endonuclease
MSSKNPDSILKHLAEFAPIRRVLMESGKDDSVITRIECAFKKGTQKQKQKMIELHCGGRTT